MNTSQSLVLSENFNFAIWIEADIVSAENKVCFNEVKPQFGRSQNIFSGCLKSLQALDLLQKQFPQDVLRMTIAFGADFWQSLNHTQEGGN